MSTNCYYTRSEVARIFKVEIRTVDRWRAEGFLKYYKLGEGRQASVRISAAQIHDFLIETSRQLPEAA